MTGSAAPSAESDFCATQEVSYGHRVDNPAGWNWCLVPDGGFDAVFFAAIAIAAMCFASPRWDALTLLFGGGIYQILSYFFNMDHVNNAVNLWLGMRPADVFVYVFLPPFLLDLSVRIDFFMFKKVALNIIFMAFVMVISSTLVLIPFMLNVLDLKSSGWSAGYVALFGSMIASTDAAAVSAGLSAGGAPEILSVILEGESLFNDASSLTLFEIFKEVVVLNEQNTLGEDIAHIARLTVWSGFTGIAIGLGIGILNRFLFVWMQYRNMPAYVEVMFPIAGCYLSFFLTQVWAKGSGCVGAVAYGLYGSATLLWGMSAKTRQSGMFQQFWTVLTQIINALIFFYVGASCVNFTMRAADTLYSGGGATELIRVTLYKLPIIWATSFVLRGVFLFISFKILEYTKLSEPISWKHIIFLTVGGLRGSLSLVLAQTVATLASTREEETRVKAEAAMYTAGFVIMTLCINAPAVGPLMTLLGLDKISEEQLQMRGHVKTMFHRFTYTSLEEMQAQQDDDEMLQGVDWAVVEKNSDFIQQLDKELPEEQPRVSWMSWMSWFTWRGLFACLTCMPRTAFGAVMRTFTGKSEYEARKARQVRIRGELKRSTMWNIKDVGRKSNRPGSPEKEGPPARDPARVLVIQDEAAPSAAGGAFPMGRGVGPRGGGSSLAKTMSRTRSSRPAPGVADVVRKTSFGRAGANANLVPAMATKAAAMAAVAEQGGSAHTFGLQLTKQASSVRPGGKESSAHSAKDREWSHRGPRGTGSGGGGLPTSASQGSLQLSPSQNNLAAMSASAAVAEASTPAAVAATPNGTADTPATQPALKPSNSMLRRMNSGVLVAGFDRSSTNKPLFRISDDALLQAVEAVMAVEAVEPQVPLPEATAAAADAVVVEVPAGEPEPASPLAAGDTADAAAAAAVSAPASPLPTASRAPALQVGSLSAARSRFGSQSRLSAGGGGDEAIAAAVEEATSPRAAEDGAEDRLERVEEGSVQIVVANGGGAPSAADGTDGSQRTSAATAEGKPDDAVATAIGSVQHKALARLVPASGSSGMRRVGSEGVQLNRLGDEGAAKSVEARSGSFTGGNPLLVIGRAGGKGLGPSLATSSMGVGPRGSMGGGEVRLVQRLGAQETVAPMASRPLGRTSAAALPRYASQLDSPGALGRGSVSHALGRGSVSHAAQPAGVGLAAGESTVFYVDQPPEELAAKAAAAGNRPLGRGSVGTGGRSLAHASVTNRFFNQMEESQAAFDDAMAGGGGGDEGSVHGSDLRSHSMHHQASRPLHANSLATRSRYPGAGGGEQFPQVIRDMTNLAKSSKTGNILAKVSKYGYVPSHHGGDYPGGGGHEDDRDTQTSIRRTTMGSDMEKATEAYKDQMLTEYRMRLCTGLKQYFKTKFVEGVLSAESYKTLSYVCDTAHHHPHHELDLWGLTRKEVSSGSWLQWEAAAYYRLKSWTSACKRSANPLLSQVVRRILVVPVRLLSTHLSHITLAGLETAVELWISLTSSLQTQWLEYSGPYGAMVLEEVKANAEAAWAYIVDRRIEAPEKFQSIQTYRASVEMLSQQLTFVEEMSTGGMIEDSESKNMLDVIQRRIQTVVRQGPQWRRMSVRDILTNTPFLRGLNPKVIDWIRSNSTMKVYGQGECIWEHWGSREVPIPGMFIVIGGVVRLMLQMEDRMVPMYLGSGGVGGLISMVLDETVPGVGMRAAYAEGNALGKGPVVLHIPREVFVAIQRFSREEGLSIFQQLELNIMRTAAGYVLDLLRGQVTQQLASFVRGAMLSVLSHERHDSKVARRQRIRALLKGEEGAGGAGGGAAGDVASAFDWLGELLDAPQPVATALLDGSLDSSVANAPWHEAMYKALAASTSAVYDVIKAAIKESCLVVLAPGQSVVQLSTMVLIQGSLKSIGDDDDYDEAQHAAQQAQDATGGLGRTPSKAGPLGSGLAAVDEVESSPGGSHKQRRNSSVHSQHNHHHSGPLDASHRSSSLAGHGFIATSNDDHLAPSVMVWISDYFDVEVPPQEPVRIKAGSRGATLLVWGVDMDVLLATQRDEGAERKARQQQAAAAGAAESGAEVAASPAAAGGPLAAPAAEGGMSRSAAPGTQQPPAQRGYGLHFLRS